METASNIIGLLLTAALLGIWFARAARVRPYSRTTTLLGAVAVACAISFLFPAISLTDDLRAEPPLVLKVSDSDFSGQKWKPARTPHTKWNGPPVATLLAFSFTFSHGFQLGIIPPEASLLILAPRGTHQGRSPPAL